MVLSNGDFVKPFLNLNNAINPCNVTNHKPGTQASYMVSDYCTGLHKLLD